MTTIPSDHPLYKPVNWKRTRTTKRHRGPLQKLASTFNIEASKMEKILTAMHNPSITGKLPFQIRISVSKEDSARKATNATEEIQAYSDGSAQNGKVGAAAI